MNSETTRRRQFLSCKDLAAARKFTWPLALVFLLAAWSPESGRSGQDIGAAANPGGASVEAVGEGQTLHFSVQESLVHNEFYRKGPVAAHVVLSSGDKPRLIVAFPAGNSGVSLWFEEALTPVKWHKIENVRAVRQIDRAGQTLYGIEAEITVDARQLKVRQAVLGSVRSIRNYLHAVPVPGNIHNTIEISDNTVAWSRRRLDEQSAYSLSLEVLQGSLEIKDGSSVAFGAQDHEPLRFRMLALTGDQPLTPIEQGDLLNDRAADDPLSRQVLAFLSYEEKLLAGSWRFLTYFGRDTLLSLRLLMPALKPAVIEAGLGSVIERLDARGEVAHEEDIGEFAILRRIAAGGAVSDAPVYDYKMVDDDYMLAPVAADYLLNNAGGKVRAAAFLSRMTPQGATYGQALVKNLRFVLRTAEPFAGDPVAANLISLKEGSPAGEWRDSDDGLGGGRVAYDVNAVLVPAALRAVARLKESGLLGEYLDSPDEFDAAVRLAGIWQQQAPSFFEVSIPNQQARKMVAEYAAQLGLPDSPALASLGNMPVTFDAVSLDAHDRAVPVMNSDIGFMVLFGEPEPDALQRSLDALMRPFPAGLLTPVGMVVASPAYGPAALRRSFTTGHYHGTVIWSWQQAMLAAGIERQLSRKDLPAEIRQRLGEHQSRLWEVIARNQGVKTSELWSWSYSKDHYLLKPFGQDQEHLTESNAAQLWSTVYLAVSPPTD